MKSNGWLLQVEMESGKHGHLKNSKRCYLVLGFKQFKRTDRTFFSDLLNECKEKTYRAQ